LPLNPVAPVAGLAATVSDGDNLDAACCLPEDNKKGKSAKHRPPGSGIEGRELLRMPGNPAYRIIDLIQE